MKLTYCKSSSSATLECFTDADWASDKSDRKSVSGHIIRFFGNVVLWTSKKQSSIAVSSCESEYISLSMFIHDTYITLGYQYSRRF